MLGLRADRETAFHAFISIFPLPILTIMSSNVEYRKEFGEDVGNMFTQTSLCVAWLFLDLFKRLRAMSLRLRNFLAPLPLIGIRLRQKWF